MTPPTVIVNSYLQSSIDMSSLLTRLNNNVEDYNLILSDLDHFLELEDLDNVDTIQITKRRKHTLVERRRAKDMIRVIDQILPKQIEGRTTQDRYEFAVHNLNSRVYTPRKISLEEAKEDI